MNKIKEYKKEIEKGCGKSFNVNGIKPRWCKSYYLCPMCKAKLRTIRDILKLVGEEIDELESNVDKDSKNTNVRGLSSKNVFENDTRCFKEYLKSLKQNILL